MNRPKQPHKPQGRMLGAALLAICLAWHPARGETGALMTGRALALLCDSGKQADQFSCQSYIAGVIDYHRLTKSLGTSPTVDFCIPDTVKMAQMKDIVSLYIRRHTEHQDFIAAPGVAMAMFNAFPCKNAKKRR